MPNYGHCSDCGNQVYRTRTSADTITCRPCRTARMHGTRSGYSSGCRCRPCKDAQAAIMREYVAKRQAAGNPVPRRRKQERVICDGCEQAFTRQLRHDRKRTEKYCSTLCRDYDRQGPLTSEIPHDHWARLYGATCHWEPPQPNHCAWCHQQTPANRHTFCSDPCRHRAKRARRRAREHGAHGEYTWGQLVHLWDQFDRACAYCRQPTPLEHIQAEHVIALSRGGANNIGNILPSCAPCNADKRDLTMTEWRTDRARRGLPPVTTQWTRHNPLYAHLTPDAIALAA